MPSFEHDVWPILRERCVRCHGPERVEGSLRLDRHELALRGGHTGGDILGKNGDSELLRRLESEDPGYRMPRDEVPLSVDQVEILRAWIAGGAQWVDQPYVSDAESKATKEHANSGGISFELLSGWAQRFQWVVVLSVVFLVSVLFIERERSASGDLGRGSVGFVARFGQRFGRSYHVTGVLSLVLFAAGIQIVHLNRRVSDLQTVRKPMNFDSEIDETTYAIPAPIRPPHPPRLGGVYYRGNDERSPRLFNGGYYRTATMDLYLVDGDGQRLEPGAEVCEGTLGVHLRVDRAPNATRELFRDEALTACFLTKRIPGADTKQFADQPVSLEVVEPGEAWEAIYPIGEVGSETTESKYRGRLYLCPKSDKAHYGIEYDIRIDNGGIAESSELWMGAIYLSSRVALLEENQIPISAWFGFQPIPQIEGENSSDRALLGISEHLPQSGAD